MLKNLSIKIKLMLLLLFAIVTLSIVLTTEAIITMKDTSTKKVELYKKEAYENKRKELRNYISVAEKTVESYYKRTKKEQIKAEVQGEIKKEIDFLFSIINSTYNEYKDVLTEEELKNRISKLIKSAKYGKNGYFWINDFEYKMVMHPIKPNLDGKYYKNTPKVPFVELGVRKLLDNNTSEDYIEYSFLNPANQKTLYKSSIVKVFKPYNWIIGTGAYIDDVTSKMKSEALKAISDMRFGENSYYWIQDSKNNMVMHPINSKLNGTNLSNIQDKSGKFLFVEFTNIANSKGEGLIEYSWPKPGESQPQAKFSYVKKFKEWDWIIGTGAYIDDIERNVNTMVKQTEEEIYSFILTMTIGAIISLVLLLLVMMYLINKTITSPLTKFQEGLLVFFKYLNKETNTVKNLDISSNDEIGLMSKIVNENIESTKISLDKDNQFLQEVKFVVNQIKDGSLTERLNNKVDNDNLEELRISLNDMLITLNDDVGRNTKAILDVLEGLSQYDFTHKIENAEGKISTSLNNVIDLITNMLVENKSNGLTLDKSSDLLLENVDKLNQSSTEAAASLEETSAALEEITGTIRINTENVAKMSHYAHNLTDSAREGENLASTTTKAMEEINEQVGAINDAITVIDQIAFQTNILSLNAAVEAATAGEAGKGFAVVAQEVRNLASRSAEAAKEIKDLVENANIKANEGKNISQSMISGYNGLNDNISNTIKLIKDIETASKEQLAGIEQINDAVIQLDRQTQENVAVSNLTHAIAEETDFIAKLVVSNADEKEFEGKETAKAKVFEEHQYSSSDKQPAQLKIKQTNARTIAPIPKSGKFKDTSSSDDWESF